MSSNSREQIIQCGVSSTEYDHGLEGVFSPNVAVRVRSALRSIKAERVAVYGDGKTGQFFKEVAAENFAGFVDRSSLRSLAGLKADCIVLGTSPVHYPIIRELLTSQLKDNVPPVVEVFTNDLNLTKRRTLYVLCSTPASGSAVLGDILRASGRLGDPQDYFQRGRVQTRVREKGLPTIRDYFFRIVEDQSSENGIFGMKVDLGALRVLRQGLGVCFELLAPSYIWLRRRDTVRQAMSLFVENYATEHALEGDLSGKVPFDREAIRRCEKSILSQNDFWQHWFATNGLTPLELWHEDVQANPKASLQKVCDYLKVSAEALPEIATPQESSNRIVPEEWVKMYTQAEV